MDKQDSKKSSAASNTSKAKKISVNDKPAKSSKLNQKKSGKNRCKYTKLFEICNLSDRPNTRARTPITQTRPEKVFTSQRDKSSNIADLTSSTNVLSKQVPEKTMVLVVPDINKNKASEKSTHALEKPSMKVSSIAEQPKKKGLTSENYDKEMFKICLTIVDEFLKQVRADKNAVEEMINKKKAQKSTTLGQIASVHIIKRKSSVASNPSQAKEISVNDKPAKSSKLNQKKSGKYTKLFEICNLSDRPNTRARTPITQTRPKKVLTIQRNKFVNTADFISRTNVLSKQVPEKTMVQVVLDINKNEEKSTHALEKPSMKVSSMAEQPKKTSLTTENYDKEMFKICLTIVDEFLKQVQTDKNADERMTNKKKAQNSTTFGQIASVDVKKKPVTSVCQSSYNSCTAIDKPDQNTQEEKKKEPEQKKSKNSRKKMKKLMKLSERE